MKTRKNLETTFTAEQLEAARLARNAKLREWRAKNPDKVKAAELRYYVKLGMKMKSEQELAES